MDFLSKSNPWPKDYDYDFNYQKGRFSIPPSQLDLRLQAARDLQTVKNLSASPDTRFASAVLAGVARRNGYNVLRDALKEGSTNIAKIMLKYGARVNNASGKPSYSPLYIAVMQGDVEMCKLLLSRGAKTYALNKKQESPLFVALKTKNEVVIRLLLAQHPGVRLKRIQGMTELHRIVLRWLSNTLDSKIIKFAKLLLNFGVEISAKNRMIAEPFVKICNNIIKLLVEVKADVHMCDSSGMPPLMKAVERGHHHLMVALLNNGAQVNAKYGKDKCTPLHSAVISGRECDVRFLLSRPDIDVDSKAAFGATPLHIAVQQNKGGTVKALLDSGATCNVQDQWGKSALHYAVELEYPHSCVELEHLDKTRPLDMLLTNNADINLPDNSGRTILHYAVIKKEFSNIAHLLSYGANVNAQDKNGETPLHLALSSSLIIANSKFLTLLQHGARTDVRNNCGKTALHAALVGLKRSYRCYRRQAVIESLLFYSVDVNAKDYRGRTPLHYAAESTAFYGESVFAGLLENGADVNAVDNKGKSALHIAVRFTEQHISDLIQYGADKNLQDSKGRTPLHTAINYSSATNVYCLTNHRVRVDLKDFNGQTPLHYVATANMESAVVPLLSLGANVNSADNNGRTPFSIALEHSSQYLLRDLLLNGADTNFIDERGRTPLHYAANRQMEFVLEFLLNQGANINAKDIDGKTPLYKYAEAAAKYWYDGDDENARRFMQNEYAAYEIDDSFIAPWLLHHGAAVDCKDEAGKTELHIAAEKGRVDIVISLLNYGADVNARTNDSHTPLSCSIQPATETIQQHIVMLAAANLHVDEMDFRSIDLTNPNLILIQNICKDQIRRSKEVEIVNGYKKISLYHIIRNDKRQLVRFVRNGVPREVEQSVKSLFNDFLFYRPMIDLHFRMAIERAPLMHRISGLFGKRHFFLPDICADAITEYLSNTDLISLITALC